MNVPIVLRTPLLALAILALIAGPTLGQEEVLPRHVSSEHVAAVEKGLRWLADHQARDGSWGGGGGQSYPVAMTALGGLALLSGGHTPTRGQYARPMRSAVEYLLSRQQSSGQFVGPMEQRTMYGHGFTSLFLGEVYGMTGAQTRGDQLLQDRIRTALVSAVDLTVRAQTPPGGYGYEANPSGMDEGSVTVTQLQGLRACMNAGIHVPRSVIDQSYKYLEICQNPDGGICYRAGQRGNTRPALTAAACATLYSQSNEESAVAEKAWQYVQRNMLGQQMIGGAWARSWYFYTHFYLAQTCYFKGEEVWNEYFPRIQRDLLARQNADGSWNGDGQTGPVYGTSLAIVILQLPYERLPIFLR